MSPEFCFLPELQPTSFRSKSTLRQTPVLFIPVYATVRKSSVVFLQVYYHACPMKTDLVQPGITMRMCSIPYCQTLDIAVLAHRGLPSGKLIYVNHQFQTPNRERELIRLGGARYFARWYLYHCYW